MEADDSLPDGCFRKKIDYRYRIEAHVTDQGKRELSGTGWVVATYGSFWINVEPALYFFAPSSTAEVDVSTRDYDGQPVPTSASVNSQMVHGESQPDLYSAVREQLL